jgi:hypothetical protein
MKYLKHFQKVMLTLAISLLPTVPMFFIEPIHKGTDPSVYGYWSNLYVQVFLFVVGLSFYYISWKIVNKFIK